MPERATSSSIQPVIEHLKRLASRLPPRYQQELKRLHFGRQIRAGIFTSAEENEREFGRLQEWVRPGDCVVDVGANVGNYTARLSELVGPAGRVISLEPVPETFELLVANIARFPNQNVTLLNVAASDTPRILRMEVPTLDTGLANRYMAHLSDAGSLAVYCLPVDQLHLPDRVSLIKVDVEGHEFPALLGMRSLLERDRPVLIVEGRAADVEQLLSGLGYRYEDAAKSPNRLFLPVNPGRQ
jgi:FkbM family methyltransferase